MMTLIHARRYDELKQQQRDQRWVKDADNKQRMERRIGVLGLGRLGGDAACVLRRLGFEVNGWTRRPKTLEGIRTYSGPGGLKEFLGVSDVVICLLPLTPDTENILCRKNFDFMPDGGYVINVGRGSHLVEQDLLFALESGKLGGACLDVFREEPLPPAHPFWTHPKITVTSHISSITDTKDVAVQIVDNYHRLKRGETLLHTIDRTAGY